MFAIAPTVWSQFQFGKEMKQGEDLALNKNFVLFAKQFVGMLDMAIDMLGPDLEMVESQLQLLGIRHINYGVLPKHYPLMGKALLQTIECKLGDQFTERQHNSWNAIYTFMSVSMMQGAFQQLLNDRNDYYLLKQSNQNEEANKHTHTNSGERHQFTQNCPSSCIETSVRTISSKEKPRLQQQSLVRGDFFGEKIVSSTEVSDEASSVSVTSSPGSERPKVQVVSFSPSVFMKRFSRGTKV